MSTKVINCHKVDNPLIGKKLREVTVEEGMDIAKDLFNILTERGDGLGLAANQVGINAAVAVVNVREPLVLINPKIEKQWEEISFVEGCLSFPGKPIRTKRYKNIVVKTEQEEGGWYFSGAEVSDEGKGQWEKETKQGEAAMKLLEAVCVQHEIDHLRGMTIHDRENKLEPISTVKIGRNEPCLCGSGKKYKKCCLNK